MVRATSIRILSIVMWVLASAGMVACFVLGPQYWLFGVTYLFLIAALILSLGFWLRTPAITPKQNSRRQRRSGKGAAKATALVLFCCAMLGLQYLWEDGSTRGFLLPALDVAPASSCDPIPKDAVALYAGGIVSPIPVSRFPHTVLSIDGAERLRISRRWDGALAVTTDFYDIKGNKIGAIVNNELKSMRPGLLRLADRDRSTLVVKDRSGLELLRLHYANPSAIQLEAFLFFPRTGPIQIKGDSAQGLCFRSTDSEAEFRVHVPSPGR